MEKLKGIESFLVKVLAGLVLIVVGVLGTTVMDVNRLKDQFPSLEKKIDGVERKVDAILWQMIKESEARTGQGSNNFSVIRSDIGNNK